MVGLFLLGYVTVMSTSGGITLKEASTGLAPPLTLQKHHKWHVFLSHIWSTGQDQVTSPSPHHQRSHGGSVEIVARGAKAHQPPRSPKCTAPHAMVADLVADPKQTYNPQIVEGGL